MKHAGGRPATLVNPKRVVIWLDGEAEAVVSQIARTTGQSRSMALRRAIYSYLGYRQNTLSEGQKTGPNASDGGNPVTEG